MADYTGGASSGALQTQDVENSRSVNMARALQAAQVMQAMREHAQQQQDRAQGGGVLEALMARMGVRQAPPMLGRPPMAAPPAVNPMAPGGASIMAPPAPMPQGAIAPPPPGTMAGGPMPPGVGVSSQPSAQAGPAIAAPPQAPIPIPPFRALPRAPAPAYSEDGGLNPIPPPPGEEAKAEAPAATEPAGINIKSLVEGFKAAGIPKDRWMAQLEQFTPLMNAQNKQEFTQAQIQLKLAHETADFAHKRLQTLLREKEINIRSRDVDSKIETRDRARDAADEANQIKRDKIGAALSAAAGGAEKLKRTDFEKDADGNIVGAVGITATGKIIRLNADGTPRSAADKGASPRADVNRIRDVGSLQRELNGLELSTSPTPEDKARKEVLKKRIAELNNKTPRPRADAAAPGGEAPLPLPKSAAEAVAGKVYQTARGPARWNGSAFEMVAR